MTLISACTDKAFRNGIFPMAFLCAAQAVAHNDNVASEVHAGLPGRRRPPRPVASGRLSAATAAKAEAGRRAGAGKVLRRAKLL